MGDSLSAIHDDKEEYEGLCRHFGEDSVRYRHRYGSDCYGPHAHLLKEAHRAGKTPAQMRAKYRAAAKKLASAPKPGRAGTYFLDEVDETWYVVNLAQRERWTDWLGLTYETDEQFALPWFAREVKDLSTLRFTNPTQ